MATIRDVARLAGVTAATVSHSLSGKRPVAEATRERVLAAVRELGYQPNATARNLAARRTRTVALSLPLYSRQRSFAGGRYFEFVAGITERLNVHGYKMLCLISQGIEAADLVNLARGGYVDGLLLLEVLLDDARVTALRQEGFPFVTIGRPRDVQGIVHVDADVSGAAEVAVRHLFELGHRRIAFLGDAHALGYHYRALVGYRAAHAVYGIPLTAGQELFYDPEINLSATLRTVLDPQSGVTALVSAGDSQAVVALHVLREHGRRVPEDVSIVALADSQPLALAQPPITALELPALQMSNTAVDLLMDMLDGRPPTSTSHILPQTGLIVRGSTRSIGPALSLPAEVAQHGHYLYTLEMTREAAPSLDEGPASRYLGTSEKGGC